MSCGMGRGLGEGLSRALLDFLSADGVGRLQAHLPFCLLLCLVSGRECLSWRVDVLQGCGRRGLSLPWGLHHPVGKSEQISPCFPTATIWGAKWHLTGVFKTQDLIGQGTAVSSWLFRSAILSNTGILFCALMVAGFQGRSYKFSSRGTWAAQLSI